MNPKYIADTIRSQIGTNTLMCIGAHNMSYLSENEAKGVMGGLSFKLGRNPKLTGGGYCVVELNYSDTYTVKIYNNRMRLIKETSEVYCDMLSGPSGVIEQVTG